MRDPPLQRAAVSRGGGRSRAAATFTELVAPCFSSPHQGAYLRDAGVGMRLRTALPSQRLAVAH
eukprot:7902857-Pyramimonas_sp.AAC.1